MIACQLVSPGRPLAEREVAAVSPGPGEVVVSVRAAGVCRSDVHYQAGGVTAATLPRTLGHEIAGTVAATGAGVRGVAVGDAVAVHYVVACGSCDRCRGAGEQFCRSGAMIGKQRDGGFAEEVLIPERNAVPIPGGVSFETAAIMMCSTATAFHALRVAGAGPADRVAVLGFGGLGASALQLIRALGLPSPLVVDVRPEKVGRARSLGATAVRPDGDELERAAADDPPDVVLDFVGDPTLSTRALRLLAPRGRLVLVALSRERLEVDPYRDLVTGERRILGCSDHTRAELEDLLGMAARGALDLGPAISERVPMSAAAVNGALDRLRAGTDGFRTVLIR